MIWKQARDNIPKCREKDKGRTVNTNSYIEHKKEEAEAIDSEIQSYSSDIVYHTEDLASGITILRN